MTTSSEIILALISAILTSGIISILLFRKQDKRLKEAEAKVNEATAKVNEAQADVAKAQAQTTIVSNYETLLDRYEKKSERDEERMREMEKFHNSRYDFIEKQQELNNAKIDTLIKSEKEMKPFLCYDTVCAVRKNKKP